MDFSQLSMLEVTSAESLTKETWINVFGSLPELETIAYNSYELPKAFTQALQSRVGSSPSHTGASLTFPAVHSLEIICGDFDFKQASVLIPALQTRPRSSPPLELKFCTEGQARLKKSVFRHIVDALPNVKVTRHKYMLARTQTGVHRMMDTLSIRQGSETEEDDTDDGSGDTSDGMGSGGDFSDVLSLGSVSSESDAWGEFEDDGLEDDDGRE